MKRIRYLNLLFSSSETIEKEPNILRFFKYQPDTIKAISMESVIEDLINYLFVKIELWNPVEIDYNGLEKFGLKLIKKSFAKSDEYPKLLL